MATPSVLLIHGAATGAWIWDLWRDELRAKDWQVNVLDLRGHGRSMPADLATVTMEDYVADVASVTEQIEAAQGVHPLVGGWGLGGMVAMMYGAQHPEASALMLFDPMTPAELGKADMETVRRFAGGVLTPESFGIYPDDRERSREVLFDLSEEELGAYLGRCAGVEESGIAVRQILRGISIPSGVIKSPSLVVSPDADIASVEVNRRLAEHLGGDMLNVSDAGHWGIVCHAEAVAFAAAEADAWLRRVAVDEDLRREGEGET
jgi:pimeloyl-ACP methyl ester carboxylesterase